MTGPRTALALALILVAGCGPAEHPARTVGNPEGRGSDSVRDEIPPEHLAAMLSAHDRGLGAMERYEYGNGVEAFGEVHRLAPDWVAGSINLAIALLNRGGEASKGQPDPDRSGSGGTGRSDIQRALRLLDAVLARHPRQPSALFCKGIILESQGRLAEAHALFREVVAIDPGDANAWLELGSTLTDPKDGGRPAGPAQARELIAIYSRALECNPYLVPALFKLQTAYGWSGDRGRRSEILALWDSLNPRRNAAGSGDVAGQVYGEMGKYARVIDPFSRSVPARSDSPPPRFDPPGPIAVALPEGHRWASQADFQGDHATLGRARARFGAGVATFDADGDGRLDLYLTAAIVGPNGPRDALLIHRADGQYEDATVRFGLPEDRAGIGVAAGDFDADRRFDLFLTGIGDSRLYRNVGGRFEDVTAAAGIDRTSAIGVGARWLDLDQDGDLDLYVINHAPALGAGRAFGLDPTPGWPNVAYRNDGRPSPVEGRPQDSYAPLAVASADLPAPSGLSVAFSTSWPGAEVLSGGAARHTSIAALDVDEDRDIDLALAADGEPIRLLLNDRAGAFHEEPLASITLGSPVGGLLAADLDKDGRVDLVAIGEGRTSAWRNATTRSGSTRSFSWSKFPIDSRVWISAHLADLDLDMWPDLVGVAAPGVPSSVLWSRNTGTSFTTRPLASGPDDAAGKEIVGFALADLAGDPLPDLVVLRDGEPPRIARNLGNGQHWLSIDLAGRWKTGFDQMRTNSQGIGTRLSLEGQGILVPYDATTPTAGPAQSVGPFVLGLGPNPSVPLLRVRWPDGVMQCELNVTADKVLTLAEVCRKTGSCPVLFTWNGERFACVGDFLGGGGLGYLVSPGVYGQPDRDESVAIDPDQLRAVDGVYRIAVVEPMDEVAYLDRLTLDVVDAPPGVSTGLDERFAPSGPRPSGNVLAWSRTVEPVRVWDHAGRDQTETVREWDRRTVDGFLRLQGWIGYAEDHALTLDFADRLAGLEPTDRVVLCLAGWVEYPYSQTNYAAATAGVVLRPPVLERLRDDGSWEIIDASPGYPAGLPRQMTVDLTGKLVGPRCVLRLTTNMECYWDQAFLALPRGEAGQIRTTSLTVARARLGDKGYLRESSSDGRHPLLYDYDHPDPAPLARMAGTLTRHGDVQPLLTDDDDQLCTVGPGDEVRIEFDARGVPELPAGWTRRFVLMSVGYCKDADPFTATSDHVGPLPWRGMPPFPFASGVERPRDPSYSAYLREYQTRPAGAP